MLVGEEERFKVQNLFAKALEFSLSHKHEKNEHHFGSSSLKHERNKQNLPHILAFAQVNF